MTLTLKERIVGCLLAGALGDAWGGPFEGTKGAFHFVVPDRPILSDDTQLTLATCEAITEHGGVDPESIASLFVKWFSAGRVRGIGSSTAKAMCDLAAGVHWALAGARGEYAAGNGAAMRVAPLAFLLDPDRADDRRLLRDVCRITHHHEEAYMGSLAVVTAIRSVVAGKWSEQQTFLQRAIDGLPDSAVRDRAEQLVSLQLSPAEVAARFGASGYVVDTVPLALYCAQLISSQPLEPLLQTTIEAGGDTDTIASIAGQIAGTVVGEPGIPRERLAQIDGADEVIRIADQFADFVIASAR